MLVGAAAGLGITAALALALFVAGLRPDGTGASAAFIFAQFSGQVAAGYVGGRFGRPLEAYHGSQAALLLFAVTTALTMIAGGAPGPLTILLSGIVALVLGSAGGVLAASIHR